MLDVNGIKVFLRGLPPTKLWRGWKHEQQAFEIRDGKEPLHLGTVVETSLRKHGGATIDCWIVTAEAFDGREFMNETINDLVARTRECATCGETDGRSTLLVMDDLSATGEPNVTAWFCAECAAHWSSPEGKTELLTERVRAAESAAGWPDCGDDIPPCIACGAYGRHDEGCAVAPEETGR